jgi:HSP20 family molecular chaperone IbpA
MSIFNSPFLLGFDQFERTIDRISKLSSDTYPPYNIEQISQNSLRITVAVAGFKKNELDVSLEGNQLQIRGNKKEDERERIFIHRGIATRQFQRNFVLADGIEGLKKIGRVSKNIWISSNGLKQLDLTSVSHAVYHTFLCLIHQPIILCFRSMPRKIKIKFPFSKTHHFFYTTIV